MRISAILSILVLSSMLSSCLKKELALPAPLPGELETVQIAIGYPYVNQVYYDCESNSIVASNSKYDWDLAFECGGEGYHVVLNTALGMLLADMGTDFNAINSTSGAQWLWDSPSGNLDSTAFGNWINQGRVYILDRQYNAQGTHQGYKKIQLISVNATQYTLRSADLNGNNEVVHTIQKTPSRNFVHFTFQNNGATKILEPDKDSWDLLFTNHHHKFSNLPLPFVLTQVLSNKYNGVRVAEDNQGAFPYIILADTAAYQFTDFWDEIGYDWKILNNQDNSFTIDEQKSFIVMTTGGLYYKIRFVDFYNDQGEKGYPKFEIQKL